jgi:hypothetical protein
LGDKAEASTKSVARSTDATQSLRHFVSSCLLVCLSAGLDLTATHHDIDIKGTADEPLAERLGDKTDAFF